MRRTLSDKFQNELQLMTQPLNPKLALPTYVSHKSFRSREMLFANLYILASLKYKNPIDLTVLM